jgi:RNA polymerase sigma-70 factor (ECF subfamily)
VSSTDGEWVEKARRGDQEAFSRLVELYQTPVYHLCYRMLGNENEAEDAAQEAFLRAYQNLKRYDPGRSFITWLLSIAAHYCIDQHRRRRLPATPLDVLPEDIISDGLPAPEKISAVRESNQRLRDLLKSLGPQDRAAVIMRYWYDFSEDEIAASLKLTVSAVKSRLHRSRRELAQLWLAQKQEEPFGERRPYESPAL